MVFLPPPLIIHFTYLFISFPVKYKIKHPTPAKQKWLLTILHCNSVVGKLSYAKVF